MQAAASDVQASFGPTQLSAEIGEPVPWTLKVSHPRRGRPTVEPADLGDELDRSWVLVSGPTVETKPAGEAVRDGEITSFTWLIMALESGERALPTLTVNLPSGEFFDVPSDVLGVRPALAAEEDVPRPLASFHDVKDGAGISNVGFGLHLALVLALLALPWWIRARRRRAARLTEPSSTPPSLEQVLAALASERSDDGASVRAFAFDLTAFLRRAVGERTPLNVPPSATDEAWAEAVRRGAHAGLLETAVAERAAELVESSEEIKYGGRRPTRFALDEMVSGARAVLEGISRGTSGTQPVASGGPAGAREGGRV